MRKTFFALFCIALATGICSCSDSDDNDFEKIKKLDELETEVTYKINCSNAETPIELSGAIIDSIMRKDSAYVIFKGSYEKTMHTKSYFGGFTASSKDKSAYIEGEVYINGKLAGTRADLGVLNVDVILKGNPPIYNQIRWDGKYTK